jgi:hypothetical protein
LVAALGPVTRSDGRSPLWLIIGSAVIDAESGLGRMIYRAKRLFPPSIWRTITGPYWWWHNRARHQAAAVYDGRLRSSRRRLEAFRDCHHGQRCFILGNGPSLAKMDLRPLKSEITFGLNRIYLHYPVMGFPTNYYLAINTLVIEQCAADIQAMAGARFITWRGRRWIRPADGIIYLDTDYTGPETFSTDVIHRVFEGSTVTYVAIQLAYFMGFSEVILIGVDHNFVTQGAPNATVVSQQDDPDHFSTAYFGKGFRWQLPDLEGSERAYRLARHAFQEGGRKILDATVGGKLTIFPKVDYRWLFS